VYNLNRPKIKTQLDAVLHFITKMDVEMVSTLLHDDNTYQEFSKSLFIRKLGDLFFEFSQLGDQYLSLEIGECVGCTCGTNGFSFIGNNSSAFIDMVFIIDENQTILDIYECGEFFNKSSKLKRKKQLYLDKQVVFDIDDENNLEGDDHERNDDLPF